MKLFTRTPLILLSLYLLSGCAAAVVGGAIVGTSVVLDKRTTGDLVEDQSIKAKFTHLYYEEKGLSEQTHINVTSYNRQLLITGEAKTPQLRQQLSNIAGKIKNVRQHFNEVVVAEPTSLKTRTNDSYLTTKIKSSVFSKLKELDGAQVKVVTENSSVYLMGLVTRNQGDQITEIARTTRGIKRVIKLFEYPHPQDARI